MFWLLFPAAAANTCPTDLETLIALYRDVEYPPPPQLLLETFTPNETEYCIASTASEVDPQPASLPSGPYECDIVEPSVDNGEGDGLGEGLGEGSGSPGALQLSFKSRPDALL